MIFKCLLILAKNLDHNSTSGANSAKYQCIYI